MFLLIPGRHHVLTDFQYRYMFRFAQTGLGSSLDIDSEALPVEKLDGIVFAVTSATHAGTRRNPLPLLMRAIQIHDFGSDLGVPVYVFGIPDVGERPDFSEFVLKTIAHESGGDLELTPDNTVVACSTPVLEGYRKSGFRIFAAEHAGLAGALVGPMPWQLVEDIAARGLMDPAILDALHPASVRVWKQYGLAQKLQRIFADPMAGADGDLTETRDYGSYVHQMDEIAGLKFDDTEVFVQPGRIGDIGCAVGSWLKLASDHPRLKDSDLYGVELARPLFELCRQRKENGEFGTPNIFFSQRNAVTGLCFPAGSMNTVHSGSLTHEIWSYGSPEQLHSFIANRFSELVPGGVWVNRDVVGDERPFELVYMDLPGNEDATLVQWDLDDREGLRARLEGQTVWTRFRQFMQDFRGGGQASQFQVIDRSAYSVRIETTRSLMQDFLMHKDYTDNWESEMHETFTFWSFSDWLQQLGAAGFEPHPLSRAFTNPWIRDNRWIAATQLWQDAHGARPADWPPTTMILAARRLW